MPEAIITYEKPETLKVLKALAEYFDFEIIEKKGNTYSVNGVTMIPGDPTADLSELSKVFTGKNLDAKKLREEAWRRKK